MPNFELNASQMTARRFQGETEDLSKMAYKFRDEKDNHWTIRVPMQVSDEALQHVVEERVRNKLSQLVGPLVAYRKAADEALSLASEAAGNLGRDILNGFVEAAKESIAEQRTAAKERIGQPVKDAIAASVVLEAAIRAAIGVTERDLRAYESNLATVTITAPVPIVAPDGTTATLITNA